MERKIEIKIHKKDVWDKPNYLLSIIDKAVRNDYFVIQKSMSRSDALWVLEYTISDSKEDKCPECDGKGTNPMGYRYCPNCGLQQEEQ